MSDALIPAYGTSNTNLHGWLVNAVAEGAAWLAAQKPAQSWGRVKEILSDPNGADVGVASSVGYNKVKRTTRELVASLSGFRHEGEFKPRWDQTLFAKAHILSNLDENWYTETRAGSRERAAVQNAVSFGTGYLYETWDKHFHGPYQGDIRLDALDPGNVTFIQLPADHNIQRAYAVIIREELPLNLARATYASVNRGWAESLTADRDNPGWIAKGLAKVQQFVAPALRVAGLSPGARKETGFPTVDIFHMYTLDQSLNETPFPIKMGAHGTNWEYLVPALGDPIPLKIKNPATDNYFTRPAEPADCLLFPLRRLTIFSNTGVGYDGSSPWWHGQVPLARIRLNDFPWEALGGSIPADIASLQEGIIAIMRLVEDSAAARLDPPMLYDDNLVSMNFAKAFNPRKAGARAAAQLSQGKIVDFPVDPHTYNVENWIPEWIASQERRMDYISGVTDMIAIAKAKQVPGADTLEKLLEMAGPIVQDLVRALEEPLIDLGEWRKAYYFQFYTRPRVITITGDDGNLADVQFRPDTLVTSDALDTAQQRADRAKLSINEFKYTVTESGLNEIHRMTTRLYYIQLIAKGFPIDWWTMAKISKIPNFGPEPEGTNNVMERYVAQLRIQAEFAGIQQEELAAAAAASGAPPGSGGPGQPATAGRPNANTAPAHIESKDGGTRSTIATS